MSIGDLIFSLKIYQAIQLDNAYLKYFTINKCIEYLLVNVY